MSVNEKTLYEISERNLEFLLEGEEQIFKHLYTSSFDMLVLLDADGNQHYVSESCEKILGYTPEELVNIPVIEQMIHPDDREKAREGLKKGIVDNSNFGGTQYRHRHKNGGWVYLEAYGSNQLNNPSIRSIVLNVRDITKRKKAEQALKKSKARLSELNATKDRMFSIIGHDLRNPFSSIIGFSELLLDQVQKKDLEGTKEYARIIRQSSYRALDLLDNLLAWAQSQSGRMEYHPESLDLTNLTNDVIELLRGTTQQKSITISNQLPENLTVTADKAMMGTIMRNLISNGIKFTRQGGRVTISAEKIENRWIISVADNGVGLTDDELNKLFRTDSRFTKTGTLNEKGTGLGLLLCKEFVEMHGGKIRAERNTDQGSAFRFDLPESIIAAT